MKSTFTHTMTTTLISINLFDRDLKHVDGLLVAADQASGSGAGGVDAGFDFEEAPERDLAPLTDVQERALEQRLFDVFSQAIYTDTSQPLTPTHEFRVARALIDVASAAMEEAGLARKLPRVGYIQMNPCPAMTIEKAFAMLPSLTDPATQRVIQSMFSASRECASVTHRPHSARPI